MKSNTRGWMAVVVLFVLAAVASTLAQVQEPDQVRFHGIISDFTPSSGGGPWEIHGTWSMIVEGESGKADFSAALAMVRSDEGVTLNGGDFNNAKTRSAHTHHITLRGGTVMPIPGGFRVSGPATITANGNFPPPFGSTATLTIEITGGNEVKFSNIALTFGGGAEMHFGTKSINGVVQNSK